MHVKNLSSLERGTVDKETDGVDFYLYESGEKITDLSKVEKPPLASFINAVPLSIPSVDSVLIALKSYDRETFTDGKKFVTTDYVVALLPKGEDERIEKHSFQFEKAPTVERLFVESSKDRKEIALKIKCIGRFYLRIYYEKSESVDLTRPEYFRNN